MEPTFRLRFIIYAVEADNPLQKDMKLGVRLRVLCDLKEGTEDICSHRESWV
jgi:hypothetical protein